MATWKTVSIKKCGQTSLLSIWGTTDSIPGPVASYIMRSSPLFSMLPPDKFWDNLKQTTISSWNILPNLLFKTSFLNLFRWRIVIRYTKKQTRRMDKNIIPGREISQDEFTHFHWWLSHCRVHVSISKLFAVFWDMTSCSLVDRGRCAETNTSRRGSTNFKSKILCFLASSSNAYMSCIQLKQDSKHLPYASKVCLAESVSGANSCRWQEKE
jgi:hypothetical protein